MEVIIKSKERAVSIQGVEGSTVFSIVIDAMRGLGLSKEQIKEGLNLNLKNRK